jgi:hypothetical protein
MPTTVITPNPATVATIHRGILPLPDTAFSSLHKKQQFLPSITGNENLHQMIEDNKNKFIYC